MTEGIPFIPAAHYTPCPGGRRIDLLVVHTMESPEKPSTAEDVAAWFHGSTAPQASAHYCVDVDSIVQCVRDQDVAWGAPGANHDGLQLEHAGRASQTAAGWADAYSKAMLKRSAKLAADLCHNYRIPPVYLRAADLIAGRRGITTHWQVTMAYSDGHGHTDPGPNFPMQNYIADVAANLASAGDTPAPPVQLKPAPPTLRRGSHGWQVVRLQKLLVIKADGLYGPVTENEVKAFQRRASLKPDGVTGPATWSALLHAKFIGAA